MNKGNFICGRCGRRAAKSLARCPYCGAYYSGTRELSRNASRFSGTKPSSKGIRNILIFLGIAAAAVLMLVLMELPKNNRRSTSQDRFAGLHAELTAEAQKAEQAGAQGELYELALMREFRGRTVSMAVVPGFVAGEVNPYEEAIETFESQTGIIVSLHEYDQTVPTGGRLPDVIAFRSPELLKNLAEEGYLLDVRDVLGEEVLLQRYDSTWLDLSTLPGKDGPVIAGIWHSYVPEVGIFYAKDNFEAAGYSVPDSWEELIDLSDKIVAQGEKPWCIGAEPAQQQGRLAAYWLQAVLLRTQSEEMMENLLAGKQDLYSPEIRRAFELISSIWFNPSNVYQNPTASQQSQLRSMAGALVAEPPGCWMYLEVNLTDLHFAADAQFGKDYDWFPMPAIEEERGQPQIVWGDVVSITNDWPATAALLDYFTRLESMTPWLDDAYSLSPLKNTPPDGYTRPFKHVLSERMKENNALVVDIFERVPAVVYDQAAEFTRIGLAAVPARRTGTIGDLAAEGSISVTGAGVDIEHLKVNIRNLSEDLLTVEIPAGTYFESGDSSMQNMVIRKAVTVEIEPGELLGEMLDAACAQIEKAIPEKETEFQLMHPGPGKLRKLMEFIDQSSPGYAVTQAAVWIVTDDSDYEALGRLGGMYGLGRIINEEEAAQAMRFVDEAGLNITQFRIWIDHDRIAERASPELAAWVRSRANE